MRRTPVEEDALRLGPNFECDRLAYADDLDFMGEGFRARDSQMITFTASAGRAGLGANETKTKAMQAGRLGRDVDFIAIEEMVLEMVDSFKYLGSTVTWDSDMQEEVKMRIAGASRCSWALNKILKSKNTFTQNEDSNIRYDDSPHRNLCLGDLESNQANRM